MQSIILSHETKLSEYFLKPIAISLILAISAQVNVLTYPVPLTLQPLVLLFIGLLCSPTTALASVGYYLTEIAIGLPFASGFSSGLITLFSPRAGYFIGFLISVYVSSKILSYKRSFFTKWIAAIIATFSLYACGITWLSILFGLEKALIVGLYPFMAEILAFIVLAVFLAHQADIISSKFQK